MRKAQIGATQALLLTTIITILLLAVFFFFIRAVSIGKEASSVEENALRQQTLSSLKAYLSTPVIFKGNNITIAELIVVSKYMESKSDMSYSEFLRAKTHEIFNKLYSKWAVSATNGFSAGSNIAAQSSISLADISDMKGGKITVYLGLS